MVDPRTNLNLKRLCEHVRRFSKLKFPYPDATRLLSTGDALCKQGTRAPHFRYFLPRIEGERECLFTSIPLGRLTPACAPRSSHAVWLYIGGFSSPVALREPRDLHSISSPLPIQLRGVLLYAGRSTLLSTAASRPTADKLSVHRAENTKNPITASCACA